jgi:hypothetical protein
MKYTLAIGNEWRWSKLGNFSTLQDSYSFLSEWIKNNKNEKYKHDCAYIFYNKKPKVIRIELEK